MPMPKSRLLSAVCIAALLCPGAVFACAADDPVSAVDLYFSALAQGDMTLVADLTADELVAKTATYILGVANSASDPDEMARMVGAEDLDMLEGWSARRIFAAYMGLQASFADEMGVGDVSGAKVRILDQEFAAPGRADLTVSISPKPGDEGEVSEISAVQDSSGCWRISSLRDLRLGKE